MTKKSDTGNSKAVLDAVMNQNEAGADFANTGLKGSAVLAAGGALIAGLATAVQHIRPSDAELAEARNVQITNDTPDAEAEFIKSAPPAASDALDPLIVGSQVTGAGMAGVGGLMMAACAGALGHAGVIRRRKREAEVRLDTPRRK